MKKIIHLYEEAYLDNQDDSYYVYELNGNKEEIDECLMDLDNSENTRRIEDSYITEKISHLREKIASYDYDVSREKYKEAELNSRLISTNKDEIENYLKEYKKIHNIYIKEYHVKNGKNRLLSRLIKNI